MGKGGLAGPNTITLAAPIEGKNPGLPRYVVVPAALLAPWGLEVTTVIEGTLNGAEMGRRTIKRWDERRWFIEVPEPLCRRAGVDTGDTVALILRRASEEQPEELARLIESSPATKAAWERLTPSGQRMLREEIAAARQAATRERRAARLLGG